MYMLYIIFYSYTVDRSLTDAVWIKRHGVQCCLRAVPSLPYGHLGHEPMAVRQMLPE